MPLKRRTKYGKITISDKIFEELIIEFCQTDKFYDRVWLAQKSNIMTGYDKEGDMYIKFSVFARFGESLKELAEDLSKELAAVIHKRTEKYPKQIIVNIAGVKAQNLIKRNMDISVEFDRDTGETTVSIV